MEGSREGPELLGEQEPAPDLRIGVPSVQDGEAQAIELSGDGVDRPGEEAPRGFLTPVLADPAHGLAAVRLGHVGEELPEAGQQVDLGHDQIDGRSHPHPPGQVVEPPAYLGGLVLEARGRPGREGVGRHRDDDAVEGVHRSRAAQQREEFLRLAPVAPRVDREGIPSGRVEDHGAVEEPPVARSGPRDRLPDRRHGRRWIAGPDELALSRSALAERHEPRQRPHRVVVRPPELGAAQPGQGLAPLRPQLPDRVPGRFARRGTGLVAGPPARVGVRRRGPGTLPRPPPRDRPRDGQEHDHAQEHEEEGPRAPCGDGEERNHQQEHHDQAGQHEGLPARRARGPGRGRGRRLGGRPGCGDDLIAIDHHRAGARRGFAQREDDLGAGGRELNGVPVAEGRRLIDPAPVDQGAVATLEIADRDLLSLTEDLGVVAGDLPVRTGIELQIVVGVASDANALEVELLDLAALASLDMLEIDHALSAEGAAPSRESPAVRRFNRNEHPIPSVPCPPVSLDSLVNRRVVEHLTGSQASLTPRIGPT